MDKRTHCDKCQSTIINGKCSCGIWMDSNDEVPFPFNLISTVMDNLNPSVIGSIFSGDHHNGYSIVIFKGDYEECQKTRKWIENNILKEKK